MSKSQLSFKIPAMSSLQNHIIVRGRTLEKVTSDYINIQRRRGNMKKKRGLDELRFTSLTEMKALDNLKSVTSNLKATMLKGNMRNDLIMESMNELTEEKKEFDKTISRAKTFHRNYFERNKSYEYILSRLEDYFKLIKQIKRASENEKMLLYIGYTMESLVNELEPYEEILGRLVLSQNSFKSKADSLVSKKNAIIGRRKSLNSKLERDLLETEELRYKLFHTIFHLRDQTHHALNQLSGVQEIDIKSMRTVLELENKLQSMTNRTRVFLSDTARFYWFIDWVLNDVIASWGDIVTGLSHDSTVLDKTQTIIDYYNSFRVVLNLT